MKPGPFDDLDFDPANPDTAEAAMRSIRAELAEGERLVWFGQPRRTAPTPGVMPFVPLAGVAASVGMLVLLAGLIGGPHHGPGIGPIGLVLALAGAALLTIGLRGGSGRAAWRPPMRRCSAWVILAVCAGPGRAATRPPMP